MKLVLAACVLLATLAAGAAHASQDRAPPDRATALTAPVDVLARDAFAAVASRFVEVERPTFTGMAGPDAPLRGLQFATAAVGAGDPGLCKATTVWIGLEGDAPPVESSTVYKIVGDLAPLPDMWNDAYGAELARKCAAAGPVLRTEDADFVQVGFFVVSDGGERVWVAARALQLAIAQAPASPVACVPPPPLDEEIFGDLPADAPARVENRETREQCARAAATVARLDLDRLVSLDITACADDRPELHCLSAGFLRSAEFNRRTLWRVTLRYEQGLNGDRDAVSVSDISLIPESIIYD